jgi:hypothetical protein
MKAKEFKKALIGIAAAALLIIIPILFQKLLPSYWISEAFKPASRFITRILSAVFGIFPFSAAEILLYLLIIGTVAYIFASIILILRRKKPAIYLFRAVSKLALTAGTLFFIFNMFWGLNYYSLSLADEIGIDVGHYSVNALRLTAESFAGELNRIAGDVPRDENGVSDFGSFADLSKKAVEGWRILAQASKAFEGVSPARPKPVIASEGMSYTGITGIYIPFTGEANVNTAVPDSSLPFTMSHELAHAAGVAPENEANYAAFLACRSNPNVEFQYSGYLSAFIYSYNALVKEDADAAYELRGQLDRRVEADLAARSAYWNKYDGKVTKAATSMNNTYLMAMSQTQGVKSYGMVVDLLIADYVSRNGNPDLT